MKYIKHFALFESIKLQDIDLKKIWDVETYMDCLAFFENEIQKANGYKDFRRWLVNYSYKQILSEGSTFGFLQKEKENRIQEYESKLINPMDVNPEGFNFEDEAFKYPQMKEIIAAIGTCLFSAGPVKGIYDKPIKDCISNVYKNLISNTLENIFWPGYLKNIETLKCLDLLDEETRSSYNIESSITKSLENSLYGYSKMEKDPNALSKKFISLLEEIGKNQIRTFENVVFPPLMDEVVINYFSSNDPETFRRADEIRKMNVPLFDKIKELLPNIDTAADLGDLGF